MRKNLLSDLVGVEPELTAVNSEQAAPRSKAAPLGAMGAVGAMSKALAQLATDRDAEVRPTTDVVELDTALLADSDFRDRLGDPSDDQVTLLSSIRDTGQQVPILVRPAPTGQTGYQIAYGHRRVAALRQLGRPARALIRDLSDEEMVIAQGAENNARRDLTFIERAHFALILSTRGISRLTIAKALSVDKTELSRLVTVARTINSDVIEGIGPAPKVGRRRWMEFAEHIKRDGALDVVKRTMGSERFKASKDSDMRFLKLFSAAAPKREPASSPEIWIDGAGRKLGRVTRPAGRFVLSIDDTLEPAFGDYLLERLPELLASFRDREGG